MPSDRSTGAASSPSRMPWVTRSRPSSRTTVDTRQHQARHEASEEEVDRHLPPPDALGDGVHRQARGFDFDARVNHREGSCRHRT